MDVRRAGQCSEDGLTRGLESSVRGRCPATPGRLTVPAASDSAIGEWHVADRFILRDVFLIFGIQRMKRRTFISISYTGLVASTLPFACSPVAADANPASLAQIWDTQTIIAIGNRYRELVPDENGQSTLASLLQMREGVDSEERAKEDFSQGKQVMVDGWLLSITEARQCALFALNQANG